MYFLKHFGYMNDKWYKYMVWLVQVGLPSIGTLYYMLSNIWNVNHVTQVLGTLTAIETFLGACLGISSSNYKQENTTNE